MARHGRGFPQSTGLIASGLGIESDPVVTLDLIDQTGVVFAPLIGVSVLLGLIDQSGQVFTFTITGDGLGSNPHLNDIRNLLLLGVRL